MVKITNGINVLEVTTGAFNSIYAKQGYKKFGAGEVSEQATEAEVTEEVKQTEEVEDEFAELTSKPISEWSKTEVKSFAAANNIDISGTKNVTEAKEIIKNFLEN